jgi:hypothetical protein
LKRLAQNLFIHRRTTTDAVGVAAAVAGFLAASSAGNYHDTLTTDMRSLLYTSLVGTTAALLGFLLTALAVLVTVPGGGRLSDLKEHPDWERVPAAYFRGSRAMVGALVICFLGLPVDSGATPMRWFEAVVVAVLGLVLVRVIAALVALAMIIDVAGVDETKTGVVKPVVDP